MRFNRRWSKPFMIEVSFPVSEIIGLCIVADGDGSPTLQVGILGVMLWVNFPIFISDYEISGEYGFAIRTGSMSIMLGERWRSIRFPWMRGQDL